MRGVHWREMLGALQNKLHKGFFLYILGHKDYLDGSKGCIISCKQRCLPLHIEAMLSVHARGSGIGFSIDKKQSTESLLKDDAGG